MNQKQEKKITDNIISQDEGKIKIFLSISHNYRNSSPKNEYGEIIIYRTTSDQGFFQIEINLCFNVLFKPTRFNYNQKEREQYSQNIKVHIKYPIFINTDFEHIKAFLEKAPPIDIEVPAFILGSNNPRKELKEQNIKAKIKLNLINIFKEK
ncbi:MAG: hypothetical protein ACTSVV_03680 [Promethearchaeota archaeon]